MESSPKVHDNREAWEKGPPDYPVDWPESFVFKRTCDIVGVLNPQNPKSCKAYLCQEQRECQCS
jgi:hypothetical protein